MIFQQSGTKQPVTPLGRSRAAGEDEWGGGQKEENRGSGGMDGGPRCPAALEDRDEKDEACKTWGGRQR